MREQDYHKAVGEARKRQLDGQATDDDRRYLKQAEADGLDADLLAEQDTEQREEGQPCPGNSSPHSPQPTEQTGKAKRQPRQSPARSTANDSTPDPAASGTVPPVTTSGHATDAPSGADGKAGTAN